MENMASVKQQAHNLELWISPIIKQDLPSLAVMKNEAWNFSPKAEELDRFLSRRFCSGFMVLGRKIKQKGVFYVGFVTYKALDSGLRICDLVVDLDYRRLGVGEEIINYLFYLLKKEIYASKKIVNPEEKALTMIVSEDNVAGQLFLRKNGFVTNKTFHKMVEDRDVYLFHKQIKDHNFIFEENQ